MGKQLSVLGNYALWYAMRGWYVFPCKEKRPYLVGGFKSAATNIEQIKGWWEQYPNAGIGIDCGRSGLVVIDLDLHGVANGLVNWRSLGYSEAGTLQSTTPTGGIHLIYRDTTGGQLHNSASKLGAGIDVRANGGYFIAPPSLVEGSPYVARNDWTQEPAPIPDALIERLTALRKAKVQRDVEAEPGDFNPGVLRYAISNAGPGQRNEMGFWLATKLREAGITYQEARKVMAYFVTQVPQYEGNEYTKDEAMRSLWSAYRG